MWFKRPWLWVVVVEQERAETFLHTLQAAWLLASCGGLYFVN